MKKDVKGFLKVKRKSSQYRTIEERLKDYRDVVIPCFIEHSQEQVCRCMDCGTPFCHWACPLGNVIPEWNDLVMRGQWSKAYELLSASNNFPEITARLCPSICEYACVLGINDEPVTIRENELAVIEQAFKKGFIKPNPPKQRTGKKIAVIGSGPAGLACADQLNKAGHSVVVFEKDDKIGGILRYGIPDFKLEKWVIDRRFDILKEEGIEFQTNIYAGLTYPLEKLQKEFDAVCLTIGSGVPRDLKIPGRELKGIHFAMDFLIQANKRTAGQSIPEDKSINAKGKTVVVIGGGDTGADCVGTALRQGANRVIQIEVMPKPAQYRTEDFPWPTYPVILKNSSSHLEGGERHWSILTKKFIGNKQVEKIFCVRVEFTPLEKATISSVSPVRDKSPNGVRERSSLTGFIQNDKKAPPVMKEIQGSEFEIETNMVIVAVGFIHPQYEGLVEKAGLELDAKGNIKTNQAHNTSVKGVFTAGDAHRGQSLIVWAISEGRTATRHIDKYLRLRQ